MRVGKERPGSTFGRSLDGLVQTFENHRTGLTDELLTKGEEGVRAFFVAVYERERPRLEGLFRQTDLFSEHASHEAFLADVDGVIRRIVIPAYARHAVKFTRAERNDFYLLPDGRHGLERLGWGLAGGVLGLLVVLAPFIPLWANEWIGVFLLGGLFFPDLRRYWAHRRYETQLNQLVARANAELSRIGVAYLMTSGSPVERIEELPDQSPVSIKKNRSR